MTTTPTLRFHAISMDSDSYGGCFARLKERGIRMLTRPGLFGREHVLAKRDGSHVEFVIGRHNCHAGTVGSATPAQVAIVNDLGAAGVLFDIISTPGQPTVDVRVPAQGQ